MPSHIQAKHNSAPAPAAPAASQFAERPFEEEIEQLEEPSPDKKSLAGAADAPPTDAMPPLPPSTGGIATPPPDGASNLSPNFLDMPLSVEEIGIQAKLTIGEPDDEYEQEADQTAKQVMRMPDPQVRDPLQSGADTPQIQQKNKSSNLNPEDNLQNRLDRQNGKGIPLPKTVQSFMEPRFRQDFNQVRVHTDSAAVQINKELGAQAFTHDNDIYFNSGRYSPSTTDGQELIAHELTHTLQQTGGKPAETNFEHEDNHLPSVQMRTEQPGSSPVQLPEAAEQAPASETPDDSIESSPPGTEVPGSSVPTDTDASQDLNEVTDSMPDESDIESEDESNRAQTPEEPTETRTDRGAQSPEATPEAEGNEAEANPTEGLKELPNGDLDLVDTELAEHQRWQNALGQVGTAWSSERWGFVGNQSLQGLSSGAATGLSSGIGIGIIQGSLNSPRLASMAANSSLGIRAAGMMGSTSGAQTKADETAKGIAKVAGRRFSSVGGRAVAAGVLRNTSKLTPIPAIGAIVGGSISAYSLYKRDWSQTGQTIANFGQGDSIWERLANSIDAISNIVDIISNGLNVIALVLGLITAGMWIVAVASGGALAPLAGTLTSISIAIGVVTTALDLINAGILQPLVTLFRALHTLESEADPREVMQSGSELSQAAQQQGGALAAYTGALGTGHLTSETTQLIPSAGNTRTSQSSNSGLESSTQSSSRDGLGPRVETQSTPSDQVQPSTERNYDGIAPMPPPSNTFMNRMGRRAGNLQRLTSNWDNLKHPVRFFRERWHPSSDDNWYPVKSHPRGETFVRSHWNRTNAEEPRREDNSFYRRMLHPIVIASSMNLVQGGAAAATASGIDRPEPDGISSLQDIVAGSPSSTVPKQPLSNTPTQEESEQQSQFTDDFQPQTGVERVNPNYPSPPATPEEIDAIREEIRQLQAERALVSQAEREMERHQTDHEANQEPLQQTAECVETGVQANEQHGESVSETQEANQKQQERQQEAQGHIEDYSNHSSDLDAIRIPLRAFIGMAHLASYLPADAGEAMGQMRDESQEVLDSFTQMDDSMETQQDTQPEHREELQTDQRDLESTADENTSTQKELQTANQDATQIQKQNDQNIQEAAAQRENAAAAGGELDGSIQEQEAMADTMSQQLQQWAVEHRQARLDALAQTEQEVTDQGMTVTAVHEF